MSKSVHRAASPQELRRSAAMCASIEQYYAAFNRRDSSAMLDLLAEDVVHEPSQGTTRRGKAAFAEFLAHMNMRYIETVVDPVFMTSPTGENVAAEFVLNGVYIATDDGLPDARDQSYKLRVGAFFELRDGRIARVSNHYNLADWVRQVS